MKRVGHLFEKMIAEDNIRLAILEVNRAHRSYHGRVNRTVARVEADIGGTIKRLREMAEDENFRFSDPHRFTIFDKSAGKERDICQPPIFPDQYLHHMAIQVAMPVFLRGMDAWCCGSVRGRGAALGIEGLKKWMKDDHKGTRWALEADIHHFYESLRPSIVMRRLRRIIKDERFLDFCFRMMRAGVTIGAYYSQWFANLTLQGVDHAIRESGVNHYVRYMDNFTLLASSKRKLRRALVRLQKELRSLGLTLKRNWQIFRTECRLITAMGYRFGAGYTLLRKRNLLRLKRHAARIEKKLAKNQQVPFRLAAGYLSRIGQLRHCNSTHIRAMVAKSRNIRICKNIVRREAMRWRIICAP